MGKENDLCCCPDWEAECEALRCKLHKLEEECSYIRTRYNESQQELLAAQAKLEMVYLIFGERR